METISASQLPQYSLSTHAAYVEFLDKVINSQPSSIHPTERNALLEELLKAVKSKGDEYAIVKLSILQTIKVLGRNPIASESICTKENLSALLACVSLPPLPDLTPAIPSLDSSPPKRPSFSLNRSSVSRSSSSATGFGSPCSVEASRILANALLLHASGRSILSTLGAGEGIVRALKIGLSNGETAENTNRWNDNKKSVAKKMGLTSDDDEIVPPTPSHCFVLFRILFLITLPPTPLSPTLTSSIITVISARLEFYALYSSLNGEDPLDPIPEALKVAFNMGLRCAKAKVDIASPESSDETVWNQELDCLLPPLVLLLQTAPISSSPPLPQIIKHAIQGLLAFPVNAESTTWFPAPPDPFSVSETLLGTSPPLSSISSKNDRGDSFFSRLRIGSNSSIHSNGGVSTRSSSPSIQASSRFLPTPANRLFSAICIILKPYDGTSASLTPKSDADENLAPPALILAKLCEASISTRQEIKNYIFPNDLDRSETLGPLKNRVGTLGALLRVLNDDRIDANSSKTAVGELLYAVCDSDASSMSHEIGYGNAGGFLFGKGLSAEPDKSYSTSSSSHPTSDPITGLSDPTDSSPSSSAKVYHDNSMTDEEKEREAERLFVMFERIAKNPAMKIVNPMQEAQQSGKFEEMEDNEEEDDEELAAAVEAEMKTYKQKKAMSKPSE